MTMYSPAIVSGESEYQDPRRKTRLQQWMSTQGTAVYISKPIAGSDLTDLNESVVFSPLETTLRTTPVLPDIVTWEAPVSNWVVWKVPLVPTLIAALEWQPNAFLPISYAGINPLLAVLEQYGFQLVNPLNIAITLEKNEFLVPLLKEAKDELITLFPEATYRLEKQHDENEKEELQLSVETTEEAQLASDKMTQFQQRWWLYNLDRAHGKLGIYLELA